MNEKNEGYCVKCKAKRSLANAQPIEMKNGRPAIKGVCETCGTAIFKILPKPKS